MDRSMADARQRNTHAPHSPTEAAPRIQKAPAAMVDALVPNLDTSIISHSFVLLCVVFAYVILFLKRLERVTVHVPHPVA